MVKLIVSDLDGTLLCKGKISNNNKKAIQYANEKGVSLILATGRDYTMIQDLVMELNCDSIVGNGAEFRNSSGEVIKTAYLNKQKYIDIVSILLKENLYFMVYTTDGFYCHQEPLEVKNEFIKRHKQFDLSPEEELERLGHIKHMPCSHLVKIKDMEEFLSMEKGIIKIEAFTSDDINKIEKAKDRLKEIEDIAYLSSFKDNIEITDVKAQKGIILEEICLSNSISKEEVMVIGDGMNDLSMFERFKYSFAPSNGDETVLDKAYKVVSDCQDDGFSEAVYDMID